MKGNVIELTKVFDGASNELVIPVYQRNYDWQERHCERLVEDLEDIARKGLANHFFGVVVFQPEGSFRRIIIDGQQRITTSSLLMLALVHGAAAGEIDLDPGTAHRIRKSYLMRDDDCAELSAKIKLKPVKNDQEAYNRIFGEGSLGEPIETSSITANYRFFRRRLRASDISGDELWSAFEKLEVMYLDLQATDDPQRIFESLNSTGLALAEADKIRNAILMGLDIATQRHLYEHYWNVIEVNVGYKTDAFIRAYLTTKLEQAPRKDRVYEVFQNYRKKNDLDARELLEEMREYSISLRDFVHATTGVPAADQRLKRFQLLNIDVVQPFMLPVLKEVREGTISPADFTRIVEIVDTYIARRMLFGVQTTGLNKSFATLYRELARKRQPDVDFADVLIHTLLQRNGASGYFPRDEDVANSLASLPVYKLRKSYRTYLFHCLENTDSKDVVDVAGGLESGELSVEHIMPQTLTEQWREELGPNWERVHRTWIHSLGNLTITGYNTSYSNRSFADKKSMRGGFAVTPYRLNDDVKNAERWDESAMAARTERLTQRALDYWVMPSTDFSPPMREYDTVTLAEDFRPVNLKVRSFDVGDGDVFVGSWAELTNLLLGHLASEQRDAFLAYARNNPNFVIATGNEVPEGVILREVAPAVYLRGTFSAMQSLGVVRAACRHMEKDLDRVTISYYPSETVEEDARENTPVKEPEGIVEALSQASAQLAQTPDVTSEQLLDLLKPFLKLAEKRFVTSRLTPQELSSLQGRKDLGDVADATLGSAVVQVLDTWRNIPNAELHELVAPVAVMCRWVEELHVRFTDGGTT
ncbi:DUF262 domain-containing protein [Corynebacterium sp. 13CS0277]|uniref:DUF262 domain-containing protein n=1 Tax=Corynebacterium sp. 13CS0277 TaxID=2071994 RepID=UPI00130498B9|nr:DUF262 domain-containing protein [Corynebacterium sp. 13CS0277]